MKSKFPYFSLITLFLLIIFLTPVIGLFQEFFNKDKKNLITHTHQHQLLNNWEYHWGDPEKGTIPDFGWKLAKSIINPPERNKRNILWFKHKMVCKAFLQDPVILIDGKGVLLTFEMFIDDQKIYKFGKLDSSGKGNFSGFSSHLIPIDTDFQDKTLSLRIFSDYANIGVRGNVFLGSKSDLIQKIIKEDIYRFVIGLFMVFIGILDLIVYKKNAQTIGSVSMFGILAISLGFYTMNVTAIKDLIFFAPVFWFNVYLVAMTLMPVGAMGFVWQIFRPKEGNIYHRIWQFHLGYAVVCQMTFILILNSLAPMIMGSILLNLLRILSIFGMLIIAGVCLKSAIKQKERLAQLYLLGFIPIILSGIHGSLVGLGKIDSSYSFVPWALVLFIISLEIIKRLQNSKTQARLKIYAEQLEIKSSEKLELIKDLHDGIGGTATNIKFLSRMGLNNPTKQGMEKALLTIAELSSDCMTEIGNFMQSLDEQTISWPALVEKFDYLGKKMLKPLGLSLNFKNNIGKNLKEPGSVLFLNILRIYKESLTNIIKHSKAKHVFVTLDITKTKIVMVIKDDGEGFGDDIIKGHGLSNMKARARKLNGILTIDSEDGTHLTLKLIFENQNN